MVSNDLRWLVFDKSDLVYQKPLAFIEEKFRMLLPPGSATFSIFSDDYSETDTCASVAILAGLPKPKHSAL